MTVATTTHPGNSATAPLVREARNGQSQIAMSVPQTIAQGGQKISAIFLENVQEKIQASKILLSINRVSDEDYHNLWLAGHFLEGTAETTEGALNSRQKMQIFLRFLSDPGFQFGVGKDEGVH
nr:unnamed protein product [Callosobruchus chinensis]